MNQPHGKLMEDEKMDWQTKIMNRGINAQRVSLDAATKDRSRVHTLALMGGVTAGALVMPAAAMAGGTPPPPGAGTGASDITTACSDDTKSVVDLVKSVVGWAMLLGGILVVLMYVIAGIEWMTAGGNSSKVSKATNRLKNATIGLGILALAFLIRNVFLDLIGGALGENKKGETNVGQLEKC